MHRTFASATLIALLVCVAASSAQFNEDVSATGAAKVAVADISGDAVVVIGDAETIITVVCASQCATRTVATHTNSTIGFFGPRDINIASTISYMPNGERGPIECTSLSLVQPTRPPAPGSMILPRQVATASVVLPSGRVGIAIALSSCTLPSSSPTQLVYYTCNTITCSSTSDLVLGQQYQPQAPGYSCAPGASLISMSIGLIADLPALFMAHADGSTTFVRCKTETCKASFQSVMHAMVAPSLPSSYANDLSDDQKATLQWGLATNSPLFGAASIPVVWSLPVSNVAPLITTECKDVLCRALQAPSALTDITSGTKSLLSTSVSGATSAEFGTQTGFELVYAVSDVSAGEITVHRRKTTTSGSTSQQCSSARASGPGLAAATVAVAAALVVAVIL
ncbi:uncharacterized protein AMSG_00944 [Thecamonas trahens ATCC 50062]|uniref:Uncharacterized protein n=1 Tax=Thecamonas trahens ATCC 50062 TaxID=461836 RepID=A0A0L0DIK5_THETB|nr:hypothetical protein AMSG_00944 [Thecamonas trahens ATCC 50062]KNC52117.1 hypothetical protein AMSG_00944 [Thecamonas trahens ATCC 50062]|eukprot:XP_013762121.1 hypothetical protein AMSG_00944 [Thecamonas trahens ATCC 50062]